MKTSYKGYYSLSSSELEELWEDGIFTFDANILLNLYRYSQSTSNELLQVIKKLKPRIWISYQAGLEFHRNRLKVIKEQEESYQTLIDALDKDESKLINQLGSNRHPFVTGSEEIIKQLKDLFKEIKSKLKKQSEDYLKLVKEDNILNSVTELFNKKVGRKYSEEELENIYKEGEVRYEKKIPPGFEDNKEKEGGRKYGDLVIWYQIIEYAKENKKPIIFVTAEQKEDWWRKNKGEIIGPCPELIEELEAKASVPFHMYRVDPFLKYSQKYLKTKINQRTFDELKAVRNTINHLNLEKYLNLEREKLNKLVSSDEYLKTISNSINLSKEIQNSRTLAEIFSQSNKFYNNLGLLSPLVNDDKNVLAIERINKATSKEEQIKNLEDRLNALNLVINKNKNDLTDPDDDSLSKD